MSNRSTRLAQLIEEHNKLVTDVANLVTLVTELKADMSAHVHGGVKAGAANTAAAPIIAAADVVQSSATVIADIL